MTQPQPAVPRGPQTWRNWVEWEGASTRTPTFEVALFSDAHITGEFATEDCPYAFFTTISTQATGAAWAMVARDCWVLDTDVDMEGTDDATFHGGTANEELAALVSLGLGIRCRSGGVVRWWGLGTSDPLGRPLTSDLRRPTLLACWWSTGSPTSPIRPGQPSPALGSALGKASRAASR